MLKPYIEKINGKDFEYYIGGRGRKLLFLHGMGATPMCYDETLELLSQNFKVIAPSIPCHGNSEKIDEFNLDGISDLLIKFLRGHKWDDFIVAGNSMGGLLSMYLAVKLEKEVKHLILVDSAGFDEHKPILRYILGIIMAPFTTLGTTLGKGMGKRFKRLIRSGKKYIPNAIKCLRNDHFLDFAKELVLEDHTNVMKKVKCKTLILWGSWDDAVSVDDAYEMNKYIKNSKVIVIDRYAHCWPVVDCERFLKEVTSFVNS